MNIKIKHLSLALAAALALTACSSDDKEMPKMNMAPDVADVTVITQTEVAIESTLMASDPEGDSLSYSLISEPALGQLTLNADGSYLYQPNVEVTGMDSFEFAVSDGVNPDVTAMVSITIETLEVDFAAYSRQAFEQSASDEPLRTNGRTFTNTESETDYSDLDDNNY